MAQRSQQEKHRILTFLAENLSFSKTLAAFPGLTIEELKGLILENVPRAVESREVGVGSSTPRIHPSQLPAESLTIFIDGASRGNPGPAGIGVVIRNQEGALLKQISHPLGETTSNVAEYRALLTALDSAIELGAKQLTIYSDSELLVNQMNGVYQVKASNLFPLWSQARQKLAQFQACQIIHIRREENAEANALAQGAVERAPGGLHKQP